jgi:hypothetical protein
MLLLLLSTTSSSILTATITINSDGIVAIGMYTSTVTAAGLAIVAAINLHDISTILCSDQ